MSALLTLLICYVGGPGTTAQAKPVVDKFLRQIERAAGWAQGAAEGAYHAQRAACDKAMAAQQANAVVVDLPAYLAQHKAWKLKPLAHMGQADDKQYFVLVRKGSYKDLAALKGKTLSTTLADEPQFLSRVVFGGKLDAAKHFQLKQTRQPLKGIRAVSRGRAEATIVDEEAYAHLAELSGLPQPLEAIHRSAKLPGLTLAAVSGRASAKLIRELVAALPKLCAGAGEKLCRTFGVSAFTKARPAVYGKLVAAYGSK